MQVVGHTICLVCNYPAVIVEEVRYSGTRGLCPKCESNWPES
jgi:hypothetical protein